MRYKNPPHKMLPNSETTDDLGSPDPLSMGFPEPLKARPQRPTTVHHNSTACKTSHNFWIRFPTKTIQKKQLNNMLNYSYHQLSNNLSSSSMVKSCQSHQKIHPDRPHFPAPPWHLWHRTHQIIRDGHLQGVTGEFDVAIPRCHRRSRRVFG